MIGYNCIFVYYDFCYYFKEVIYGVMDDYVYDYYGWFGFIVEFWDVFIVAGIEKEDLIEWFCWYFLEDDYKLM